MLISLDRPSSAAYLLINMKSVATLQVSESELLSSDLDTCDTLPPRDAQWFVNCLEYTCFEAPISFVRKDTDLSRFLDLLA